MKLTQYQIDAFSHQVFSGNPAAVVPLTEWMEDSVLQAIAEENNLSETAFFVPSAQGFQLRWFTPSQEVDLCGHATLAAAHVLFEHLNYVHSSILFETRSGVLSVEKSDELLTMSFPVTPPRLCDKIEVLAQALGQRPSATLAAADYLAVFDSIDAIHTITPNQNLLSQLDLRGVIITAPGIETDFVSRFFAPKYGIQEDPVTGSAHCALAPYWSEKLGKNVS